MDKYISPAVRVWRFGTVTKKKKKKNEIIASVLIYVLALAVSSAANYALAGG